MWAESHSRNFWMHTSESLHVQSVIFLQFYVFKKSPVSRAQAVLRNGPV